MATTAVFMTLFLLPVAAARNEDIVLLSELPLQELLAQIKTMKAGDPTDGRDPVAMFLVAPSRDGPPALESSRRPPARKTFYDDYEDEKISGHKKSKKDKHKIHDILHTSIAALSYLAFGGYLLCVIVSALREKRRRYTMAYPSAGPAANAHFANFQVLQHLMNHRPARPFTRFPAVTLHHGGRGRRRRSVGAGVDGQGATNVAD